MKDLHQLLAAGQNEAALAALNGRLDDAPHDGELLLLKGVALFQTGAIPESEQAFRQALAYGWHTVTEAWKNLASICYRARRFQEAVDLIAQYRESTPRDPEPLALHVSALLELGRFAEAERELEKHLEVFPDDLDSHARWLHCLGLQRRYLELLAYTGRLPEAAWHDLNTVGRIANALEALGLPQSAKDLVTASVQTDAVSAAGRENTDRLTRFLDAGLALAEHRFVQAIELFRTLIPGGDEANAVLFNLSLACLAAGHLGEGWRLMRARTSLFPMTTVRGVPAWDGQALAGKLVLVHSEQGIGDVIQFIRFLPRLEATGVRVVFNAYPEILRLLRNDPRAKPSPSGSVNLGTLQFDFQAQLLDLPAMLGTDSVDDIPAEVPYLHANADRLAYWRRRLATATGLRIGLVWAGNPEHKQDHHRSARLSDFESLAVLPGVSWIIIQKGSGASEGLSPPQGMAVTRLSDEIANFDDTAAIVESLDLVISVDTSVAHLAGALDKPVWILLADSGKDWRWFADIERSPWYPSARLFTRPRQTGWADFVRNTVRPALAQWLFDRHPDVGAWALVRQAISDLIGDAAAVSDPAGWIESFRQLGFSPLPVARAMMREHGKSSPLAILLGQQSEDPEIVSAWAEWLLLQDDPSAAFEQWGAVVARGGVPPPSGYIAWGGALHEQGSHDRAGEVWERALSAFPDDAQLHYMAGRTVQGAGLSEAAVAHYERALALSPRHAQAHNNRGILHERDAPFLALASFQRALLFDDRCVQAWENAARVMMEKNAARIVAILMRERCAANRSAASRVTLAKALLDSGQTAEAKAIVRQLETEDCNPDADEMLGRAFLYRELGSLAQSRDLLRHLAEAFPNCRPGRMLYGWNLLAAGNYKEGWLHYAAGCGSKPTKIPEWHGEPLYDRSLLIFQDQGMGDLFQFMHLIRLLPDGADVTLAVADSALALVSHQRLPCKAVATSSVDWQASDFDFQIAQMKLQNLLAVDLLNPPSSPPYMIAPRGLLPYWEGACASDRRFKVGIVWAGNPRYLGDSLRSTRLRDWLPLFDLPDVSFYSLQKDVASNQALAWDDLELQNIAVDCESWEKTANAIALLDLVISVDTGVAHLAACLGKPTWIVLPGRGTDFRWMLEREDVPWYPQARLFRQKVAEPWSEVFLRVRKQLSDDLPSLRHGV